MKFQDMLNYKESHTKIKVMNTITKVMKTKFVKI